MRTGPIAPAPARCARERPAPRPLPSTSAPAVDHAAALWQLWLLGLNATPAMDWRHLRCNHRAHSERAHGDNAARAAGYPVALNDALVAALTGCRRTTPLPAPPLPAAAPRPDLPPPAPLAAPAPDARPAPAPSAPQPTFDRSIASGYIADGPQLLTHITHPRGGGVGWRRRAPSASDGRATATSNAPRWTLLLGYARVHAVRAFAWIQT